jgi:hypothetical protein
MSATVIVAIIGAASSIATTIISVRIKRDSKQLQNNGGSSARDAIDRLEQKLDALAASLGDGRERLAAVEALVNR